jgi:hypothetical protein
MNQIQKQALRDDLVRLAQTPYFVAKLRFFSTDADELRKVEKISKDMNLSSEWINGGINVHFRDKASFNAFKKAVENTIPEAEKHWRSIESDMGSGHSPFWGG